MWPLIVLNPDAPSSPHTTQPSLCLLCIMQAIDLKDCDVYSYKTDGETDPFGERQRLLCRFMLLVLFVMSLFVQSQGITFCFFRSSVTSCMATTRSSLGILFVAHTLDRPMVHPRSPPNVRHIELIGCRRASNGVGLQLFLLQPQVEAHSVHWRQGSVQGSGG